MKQYYVYFIKHVTKYTMRYGIYNSKEEAEKALEHGSSINSHDSWYIEEKDNCTCDYGTNE